MGWAWRKTWDNAASMILPVLIIVAISFAATLVGSVIDAILGLGYDESTTEIGVSIGAGFTGSGPFSSLASIAASLFTFVLQVNYYRMALGVTDGRQPQIAELFSMRRAGGALALWLFLFIGTILGLCLVIIGAIIWVFFAWFAAWYLADQDAVDPVQAIRSSFRLTADNFGTFLLVAITSIGIGLLGLLACGVGIIFAAPIVTLLSAYTFRHHTRGAVAA